MLTKTGIGSGGRQRWIAIAVWSVCLIAMSGIPSAVLGQSVLNQSTPLQSTPLQSRPATSTPPGHPAVLTTGPHVVEITANGKTFRLGARCTRRTDTEPGVYRKDGCNRWYCGRADKEDVSEILPRLSVNAGCTWHVEADNRCVCRVAGAPGKGAR